MVMSVCDSRFAGSVEEAGSSAASGEITCVAEGGGAGVGGAMAREDMVSFVCRSGFEGSPFPFPLTSGFALRM